MIDVASYRASLLRDLHGASRDLLFRPEPPKKAAALVEGLRQVFVGWQEIMEATSTSNSGYEERDLPQEEKILLAETRHALKILDSVYVEPTRPQAMPMCSHGQPSSG